MASTFLRALAYTRAPGNALSFWLRRQWQWSRGIPRLPHEPKDGLLTHLRLHHSPREALALETLADHLAKSYHLADLYAHSTQALYRKALYLLHCWDEITQGMDSGAFVPSPEVAQGMAPLPEAAQTNIPPAHSTPLRALDVGSQDWHYVFALERWLRYRFAEPERASHGQNPQPENPVRRDLGRQVELLGLEVDGFERYRDFYTRRDYALAYAQQTENPQVTYQVGDLRFLDAAPFDWITWLFPLVTRYETLLWGLPAPYADPQTMAQKLALLAKPKGWLLLMTHSQREHILAQEVLHNTGSWECHREGPACNPLVDFHERIQDRRISLWQRRST